MSVISTWSEPARAKVNLYLHVTGRRGDGYHLLDSLAVFPPVGDVLSAQPQDGLTLELSGPFGERLAAEADNLVLRAARALAVTSGFTGGARLRLEKNLPIASGIGGGSADAAAALRLLQRVWRVEVQPAQMMMIATGLGADVAVCLDSVPARMQGTGEVLVAAPGLPACGIVLVNPGVGVATPAVFRARAGAFTLAPVLPPSWSDAEALAESLAGMSNDLEAAAVSLAPAIGEVLAALRAVSGSLLARMSGSGATCFALFADSEAAVAAAGAVARPGWWCWGGPLASADLPERVSQP